LKLQVESSRNPLFDAVFAFQNTRAERAVVKNTESLQKVQITDYSFEIERVYYELLLNASEFNNRVYLTLEYATELFKESTARLLCDHFLEIVQQVLEDRTLKIDEINISHNLISARTDIPEEEEEDFRL